MQGLLGNIMGGSGSTESGDTGIPDLNNFAQMLGKMGGEEDQPDSEQIKEAQKMFEDLAKEISKDDPNQKSSQKPESQSSNNSSNPMGGLGNMFKDFEKISKEAGSSTPKGSSKASSGDQDPFAQLFAGMGGEGGGDEEKQMMNMFKGLMGSLGKEGEGSQGEGGPSDGQMNDVMKQFTEFLGQGDQSPEFKGALESVVKDIISKESMYGPMKLLKDKYPDYLEKNWQSLDDSDLERYNKQLDVITDICTAFEALPDNEKESKPEDKEKIFEMLNQLQELGHPPESLMTEIHGQKPPSDLTGLKNPFDKLI